jgi:hypothetical protein
MSYFPELSLPQVAKVPVGHLFQIERQTLKRRYEARHREVRAACDWLAAGFTIATPASWLQSNIYIKYIVNID